MKISAKLQAHIRLVMEERVAFNHLLGLKIASFDADAPQLRFDMRPALVGNPSRNILHGGVISATLDVVGALAIMLQRVKKNLHRPGDTEFPNIGTIDLRVDYLRPGHGKHFIATGRVVRLGSRVAVTHMELVNDSAELIATGGAAYMIG
ncbi:MAG: thioesterase family protein [Betaproteobacteria bacterium]|nr:thioesterase family protein [Betaproteobacteria bacterium]